MAIVTLSLLSGCGNHTATAKDPPSASTEITDEIEVLGTGKNNFIFVVTEPTGQDSTFKIYTDRTIVGEALLDLELISGEQGPFGLYVKNVNGIRADFDLDGMYWSFYINGEYATAGVESVEITDGSIYSFKAEKS